MPVGLPAWFTASWMQSCALAPLEKPGVAGEPGVAGDDGTFAPSELAPAGFFAGGVAGGFGVSGAPRFSAEVVAVPGVLGSSASGEAAVALTESFGLAVGCLKTERFSADFSRRR